MASKVRKETARELHALSVRLAALTAQTRRAIRLIEHPDSSTLLRGMQAAEILAFDLGERIERGEITLEERDQEPRPLLDALEQTSTAMNPQAGEIATPQQDADWANSTSPSVETQLAPIPQARATVADFPEGTELNQCGRCNALRLRRIHPCPRCYCPEYEGKIIAAAGQVLTQPNDKPATTPKVKREKRRQTFMAVYRWDENEPPIQHETFPADSFQHARTLLTTMFQHESIRLPTGEVVRIDFDKIDVVQVPAPSPSHRQRPTQKASPTP